MKITLKLLLTFLTPLLLLNCSGKSRPHPTIHYPPVQQSLPPKVDEPRVPTPHKRPSLVRRIDSTTENETTPLPSPPLSSSSSEESISEERVSVTTPHGESRLTFKTKLSKTIKESSGLIKIDNRLWTLNDSGGEAKLYQIDERTGQVIRSVRVLNATNYDWEDIAYDENYVYIGDIGNNRGNRRELRVYKIPRADLRTQKRTRAEVIHFSYSDQKDFSSKPHNNNYDCEAMVAYRGKLYLFSKDWQDSKTRLYELSTTAGKQIAHYKRTFNIGGFVTGASLNKELGILLLTTYNSLLNVNVWAFSNYGHGLFFNGKAKRLHFKSLMAQVEGVTFIDNYSAYLSSETLHKFIFSFDATLYRLDFSGEF